jgi:hypothetical protein
MKVASGLGCHHSQPVRWKVSGIPPRRWRAVEAIAIQAGRTDITVATIAADVPAIAASAPTKVA